MIALVLAVSLAASAPPEAATTGADAMPAGATPQSAPVAAAPADTAAGHDSSAARADSAAKSDVEAAPADTAARPPGPRVPGSWMRLGDSEGSVLARGAFKNVPGVRGFVTREGNVPWYGLPSTVTLKFRGDALARAEFAVEGAAPYWVDYVQDQLRLAGYRARCEQDEPGLKICDWLGATHVRLELRQGRLLALVFAAETSAAPPARTAPPAPAARLDTVPVFPQVFVLGRAAPAGVAAVPSLADSTPLLKPTVPPSARAAGVQGRVWVRALVDTNGAVRSAEIVRSIPELDSAAVAVARSCRFRPYPPDGAPVRFQVEIPVMFTVR